MDDADWLSFHVLRNLRQLTVPIVSYLFISWHMVEATRACIAAGGVRSLNEGVLRGDSCWKFCWKGYALGLWFTLRSIPILQVHFYNIYLGAMTSRLRLGGSQGT